ncbi:recombination protein RecR [Candidatus Hakubella thermalkaliphila]|uniref:Recombination protein RecR n=1 Tax=Candidatus Hakubella thermalkaliphila TaxID=2754717 RepID=A0A6V8Q713_9ACTN|nr:recombination mediator RecR [Candidatus Hakubella thermalkaliphila]MBT9171284.1 Recombination protein RecR [Actinomycetota bacterium]GFP18824.1 recombination protein RecR [Candidatus Hakubella thermalkaliphila]GFP23833.1 recombination protein RecR [Candidatus Hakubella thermalkaliphila]GFP29613.1 recombination protein RecR [Candidatus Hakubella thermalkaliphila]GFP37662.1 recombination protein RecR [Candidatus Hakubella thermalkaliphila]
MAYYTLPVENLIEELRKLPGIGPKSAQRIAFYLLKVPRKEALKLAHAIAEARDRVKFCQICFNVTEREICEICSNSKRDSSAICVVEEPMDIVAIERTNEYKGLYHVLGGAISPIQNIGPDEIRIKELLARVKEGQVKEVIVATNPNIEGETTAMYISRILSPLQVKVTRLASGLPVGGDLEYADELTLGKALAGRREI